MRLSATLLFSTAAFQLCAQVSGGQLSFDGADDLHLDSIYPAGCWQVGHPSKPIFTSAYSEPNALVTDTVLPHMDSTTCYAQFSVIAENGDLLTMEINFRHWLDMDSLSSFGWIEHRNAMDGDWMRVPNSFSYYMDVAGSHMLWTDSGVVFTGHTDSWISAHVLIQCIGVLMEEEDQRGGGQADTMQLRFAFRGGSNPNGRDGWMIDDIDVIPVQCWGGLDALSEEEPLVFPDPAQDVVHVKVRPGAKAPRALLIDQLGHSHALVTHRGPDLLQMDLHKVPPGSYTLMLVSDSGLSTARLMVVR